MDVVCGFFEAGRWGVWEISPVWQARYTSKWQASPFGRMSEVPTSLASGFAD
jgi:hypothetical protein